MTAPVSNDNNPTPRALHFALRCALPLWDALRYSSPLPVRFFLAIGSLLWSWFLIDSPRAVANDPVYLSMFQIAPPSVWSAIFLVNGLLLGWRVFDPRPRIGITRIINASTVFIWLMYIGLTLKTYGCLPPDSGDEIAILIASIWATLRTSLTVADRGTA